MTLLLLACAGPADDSAAPPSDTEAEPEPTAGRYTVELSDAWEGECDLADPATYRDPVEEWTFDPRGDVLILYPNFWDVLSCSLDGLDFSCDDGSWSASRMQVTRLVEGTFPSDGRVEGALVLELDCGGAGCDSLKDSYGRGLDFPCRSEAPFEGRLE